MNAQRLIAECERAGVSIHLVDGSLKLRGNTAAVNVAVDRLRPHKAELLVYLRACAPKPASIRELRTQLQAQQGAQWQADLVQEFQEIDGLPLAEAQALAAISVQPRSEAEWLSMISELDTLIERYVAANGLPEDVQARLLGARSRQSLASIIDTTAWFKAMLDGAGPDQRLDDSPQEGGSDGQ
jgi:hypothetical protein